MFPHCMLMGLFLLRPSWILTGNEKKYEYKNANISETVRVRAISNNF